MINVFIDNTISPLSYVSAPPNITKDINTLYRRPIKVSDAYIKVVATVVIKSASHIKLKAGAMNTRGKIAATAIATCIFIKGNRQG